MVGYQRFSTTNYRIWIPETGAIVESPHVTFDESQVYRDSFKYQQQYADLMSLFTEEPETYNSYRVDRSLKKRPTHQSHLYVIEEGSDDDLSFENITAPTYTFDLSSGGVTTPPGDSYRSGGVDINQHIEPTAEPTTQESVSHTSQIGNLEPERINITQRYAASYENISDHEDHQYAPNSPRSAQRAAENALQDLPDSSSDDEVVYSTPESHIDVLPRRSGRNVESQDYRQLSGIRPRGNNTRGRGGSIRRSARGNGRGNIGGRDPTRTAYAAIANKFVGDHQEVEDIHGDPQTYSQAIRSPHADNWRKSMDKEMSQLADMDVFDLLDLKNLPPNKKLIRGRWVYKIKLNADGSISKYKSRWVVKGFMQQEGIDYTDTVAPTLRDATFRILFALVAYLDWDIYQMDVIGAFLNSDIDFEIYMEPPTGYYPGKICRLLKSLYGLKQSPYL